MKIVTLEGVIKSVTPLSDTAREVVIAFQEPFESLPGSFVNFFMDVAGTSTRRAYSVVATDAVEKTLTLSIRKSLTGTMTPEFWKDDIVGRKVRIMGPMGLNTADKLAKPTLHLVAYGIGCGVIRAIAEFAVHAPFIQKITITTGSRNENDILYKSYFDALALAHPHVSVRYVISDPKDPTYPYKGYAQDHIDDYDFNNSDVYMCGQEKACNSLIEKIKSRNPEGVTYFIEAFH